MPRLPAATAALQKHLAMILTLLIVTSAALDSPAVAQDATPEPERGLELEAQLDRIARETAALRELPPLPEIDDVLVSSDELAAMLPVLLAEETDAAEVAGLSRALAALGLIPEATDLVGLNVRLMDEQALGFYDLLTDEMIVVADGDFGAVEEYFYAHEVVHALQDAHLASSGLWEETTELNGDTALAALALFEGDAVYATNRYLMEHPEVALALLEELQVEYPELDRAPAAVSIALLFPYTAGNTFVDRLHAEGGWQAVNAAHADVPASTEQILHPRKYLSRDRPVAVALPEPAALGAGWRSVATDTLGELQTALLLADFAPGEGISGTTGRITWPETARNAAAGWDGDRFALWEDDRGEREVLVWRSVWDTPRDARDFSRALADFGNERWGSVFTGESPDDIALVTPDIAARILFAGQEVLYVQAPDLPLADAALAALQAAPPPDPTPGPA